MKIYIKILRVYFKFIAFVSPRLGGKSAFKLFQKVRRKKILKREEDFFKKAEHFKIPFMKDELHCYESGDQGGDLIFLVHGWDSNAGSLSNFAFELASKGYRVISFDLPGHSLSRSNRSNLFECKEAFKSLLDNFKPDKPFSVISHSFGSGVVSYALSELDYKVDKMVFLSVPNYFKDFFSDFKRFIDIDDKAYKYMIKEANILLGESLDELCVEEKLRFVEFRQLLLIHDKYDKILPYKNSEQVFRSTDKATIKTYEKIGHYRMLWNDDVLKDTMSFISREQNLSEGLS